MTNGKKSLLTIVMSVVMALAIVAGCLSFVNTKTVNASSVAPTFETVEGAWIRTHEVEERFGIKFQIRMDSEEYNTFLSTYSDVEFGMFIMPEDYRASKGEFTEANLFGNEVYCWEGNMVDGKTEILNMAQAEMPEVDGAYNYLEFAITNVKPENTTRPFAGVGYIKYNDGESVKYVIDDNGAAAARSIAQVAQDAKAGELPESVTAVLDKILAVKPAVKVSASKYGNALRDIADAIELEANALDYAIGEELDITTIAEANAPEGYKVAENSVLKITVPAIGNANFDVRYEKNYDFTGETTGNLADAIEYDGYVSTWQTRPDSLSNVFNYSDDNLHFWTASNTENAIVFDTDFVKTVFAAGYTDLKLVYSVTITTNVGGALQVAKLNGSTFTNIGNVKGSISTTKTNEEVVIKIDTTKLDFDNGDKLAIGKTAAGNHNPLKITISHLEFTKPEDITKITGNIAGVAVDKAIVSANFNTSDGNNKLYDANETTIFNVGRNGLGNMLFDMNFVKAQYEKGLTTLKITFSVATKADIWARFGLGYYDASKNDGVIFGADFNCSYATPTRVYPETYIWTITPELWNSLDIAGGDKLGLVRLQAGDQAYVSMTITHLEFYNKLDKFDYEQNILNNADLLTGSDPILTAVVGYSEDWVQHLDTTSSTFGNKYLNIYRQSGADTGIIFNKEYINRMFDAGYTVLNIYSKSALDNHTQRPKFYDTDFSSWTNFDDIMKTETTEVDGVNKYSVDFTGKTLTNDLFVGVASNTNAYPRKIYIDQISFAKPAQA